MCAWANAAGAGPFGKDPKVKLPKEYEVESSAVDAEESVAV